MDNGIVAALKAPALYAAATVAGAGATWGDLAIDIEVISPLAGKEATAALAAQQAAFMAGPKARDRVLVSGYRADLEMQLITITHARLGYAAGAVVLVLAATENDGADTTTLTVLKRL